VPARWVIPSAYTRPSQFPLDRLCGAWLSVSL
jgi:hypothetical protein